MHAWLCGSVCVLVFLLLGDGLGVYNFVTKSYWRASNFVTPPKKLEREGKVNIFFTYVLRLNLDEHSMGIAVLYFASLCLFFRRFFEVFKINFVTKSDKVQICREPKIMLTQGRLDYNWFYSLKILAHFWPKVLVDFLHYVTRINCLTGAIISQTHTRHKHILIN